MSKSLHYVIIGNGVAGNEAAWHIRQRDPKSRVTLVTAGKLLFINRYEFPRVFNGAGDWRELLVHPPSYYEDNRITVRRNTRVVSVDTSRQVLKLRHMEELHFDRLLVASGGGGFVPEVLRDSLALMHRFGTFGDAIRARNALPKKGHVVMIGGDMIGLDLARALIRFGYRVTVVNAEHLFWPHSVQGERKRKFVNALDALGIHVLPERKVRALSEGGRGKGVRRIQLDDGKTITCDVVMPFCGLMPALGFMVGANVDIERGLLVDPHLQTTDRNIWAAGDVCQIWSPEENNYRFYYGWKNVKEMGRVAAFNMTGGNEKVSTYREEKLTLGRKGNIRSPYWEYG